MRSISVKFLAFLLVASFTFSCDKEDSDVLDSEGQLTAPLSMKKGEEELQFQYYKRGEFEVAFDQAMEEMASTEEPLKFKVVFLENEGLYGISNFVVSDYTGEELEQGICTCDFPIVDYVESEDPCAWATLAIDYSPSYLGC